MSLRYLTTLVLLASSLVLGCGGSGSGTSSGTGGGPSGGGSGGGSGFPGSGGSVSGGGAAGVGGSPGSGGSNVPGAPIIQELLESGDLTDSSSLLVTALVTDPDGLGDLVGGKLFVAPSHQFVDAFTAKSAGTFTVTIGWDQIHNAQAIQVAPGQATPRTLEIEFTDTKGLVATTTLEIDVRCDSPDEGTCDDGKCEDFQGAASCDGIQCAATTNQGSCFSCCQSMHPQAYNQWTALIDKCACEQCAVECAGGCSGLNFQCMTCMFGPKSEPCYAKANEACAKDPTCAPYPSCKLGAGCDTKPEN